MRLKDARFSIPNCMFEDGLPNAAFVLLAFLFSRSDCSGKAEVSYEEMMEGADIGSRNTVSRNLQIIKEHGWIEYKRRCGSKPSRFFLMVPEKYARYQPRNNVTYIKWKSKL